MKLKKAILDVIGRDALKAIVDDLEIWEGSQAETFDAGWKNKLIWGDNLLVMGSITPEVFWEG